MSFLERWLFPTPPPVQSADPSLVYMFYISGGLALVCALLILGLLWVLVCRNSSPFPTNSRASRIQDAISSFSSGDDVADLLALHRAFKQVRNPSPEDELRFIAHRILDERISNAFSHPFAAYLVGRLEEAPAVAPPIPDPSSIAPIPTPPVATAVPAPSIPPSAAVIPQETPVNQLAGGTPGVAFGPDANPGHRRVRRRAVARRTRRSSTRRRFQHRDAIEVLLALQEASLQCAQVEHDIGCSNYAQAELNCRVADLKLARIEILVNQWRNRYHRANATV